MTNQSLGSASVESLTSSRFEFSLAAPIVSEPEPCGTPNTIHTEWLSQEQGKDRLNSLMRVQREEFDVAAQRLAVFVDVVVDFCIAHCPKGNGTAMQQAITMLCSQSQEQAITIH